MGNRMENKKQKINENIRQFILYLIVGGGATLVEWVLFHFLNGRFKIHYMIATSIAFAVSTFANWAFGRLIMFQAGQNVFKELVKIYLTAVAGLLMNLAIMWLAIEQFHIDEMLSKIIATGIVFFWNFLIRKFLIYKV